MHLLRILGVDRFAWRERTLTLAVGMPEERVRLEREERDDDGSFQSQEEPKP